MIAQSELANYTSPIKAFFQNETYNHLKHGNCSIAALKADGNHPYKQACRDFLISTFNGTQQDLSYLLGRSPRESASTVIVYIFVGFCVLGALYIFAQRIMEQCLWKGYSWRKKDFGENNVVELEDMGEQARRRRRAEEDLAAASIWDPPPGPNVIQILDAAIRSCFR